MFSWRLSYTCCAACAYCVIVSRLMLKENDGRIRPAKARWRRRHDQMLGSLTETKCDSAQGDDTLRDALPPIITLITAKRF